MTSVTPTPLPPGVFADNAPLARFRIEAAYSSEDFAHPARTHYAADRKAATQEFQRLHHQYPCVWLAEYGRYRKPGQAVPTHGWLIYRWTREAHNTDYVGPLTGYPVWDEEEMFEYSPVYQDGSSAPE